ncbi:MULTISPECIES: SusC/RagA family TonB-linked outer membrane protein [Sphingobacteriaceae]|uniref:TonB-dependent receptor plug n=1 Tax=Sphingobacterium sp. (strain 21) TaxID=743722 RepID=F4C6M8_SPHS2
MNRKITKMYAGQLKLPWRINALRTYCLLTVLLFYALLPSAFSQQPVRGKVISSQDGASLPGVSVFVKGTKQGTTTDADGNFVLQAGEDAVLVFSFMGYHSKEVPAKGVSTVPLEEDSQGLDEVVVIGYGTARRRDLTGAVGTVKGSEIRNIPVTNAAQAITGRVAGVNVVTQSGAPGADINITVRGGTSITQGTNPLYIVDGFQMENALRNVDINDIESIEVLKDASATAIYGARGANGVILITTKSGKSGKTEVNYNTYFSFEKLSSKLDLLSTEQYVKYQYEFQTLGGKESQWANMFGGDVSSSDFYTGAYDRIARDYGSRAGIDWQDLVFGDQAILQNHNVNINGGSEKTKFMVSYNFTGQDGILAKTGYERNSVRAKFNQRLAEGISLDFNTNLQATKTEGGGSLGGMLKMSVLQPPTGGIRFTDEQLIQSDIAEELQAEDSQYDIYNPIITNDAVTQTKYARLAGVNMGLNVDFLKDFTFRTAGSYQWTQTRSDYWDDGRTRTAQNNKGPYGSRNNSEKFIWQIVNTLSWKKSFDKHNFNAVLGQETTYEESMSLNNTYYEFPENNFGLNDVGMAGRIDRPSSDKSRYGLVSGFARLMYNYDDRYLLTATIRRDGVSKFMPGRQWGTLPSASAAWNIDREQFMENIDFFDQLKFRVGYGTTGNCDIGNNTYTTLYQSTTYAINNVEVNGLKPTDKLGNPLLQWEKTQTTNIGLDFSILKNRVSLTADYYNNISKNLLISVAIPTSTGYTSQNQNVASIRNRGFEFLLNTVNVRSNDFQWTTSLNISFNRSKVLSLFGGDRDYMRTNLSSRVDFWTELNNTVGLFYGYQYDGIYTTDDFIQNGDGSYTLKDGVASLKGKARSSIKPGDVKYVALSGETDADGNPVWSTNDRTVIGTPEPKYFGGINNTFAYKGFDLSVFLNFSYGNQVFNMNSQRYIGPYLPNQNSLSVMNNRFTLIDPATGMQTSDLGRLAELNPNQHDKKAMWSLHSPNNIAITDALDYYLEDGSFLRINNITLGYTLPKSWLQKAFINNARIYCTLNNIHTFTGYSGYDPEVSATGSILTRGVDNSAYPRTKSIVVGANLTF